MCLCVCVCVCVSIFRQNELFRPNFARKEILGSEFQKSKISAPSRYLACQFLIKMDNFQFLGLNLGKLPNFGFNRVEGVAESWVEAEWAAWSWVELGTLFCDTHYFCISTNLLQPFVSMNFLKKSLNNLVIALRNVIRWTFSTS